jgi:putative ABC transport system substrate-binding protein
MKRRTFITLLGGATVAGPLVARAQQRDRPRRIGVLMGAAPMGLGEAYVAAFLRRLDELGWRQGRDIRTEVRWWTGGPEQMRPAIAELLAFSPDVIMVFSNLALAVLKPIAGNVPIVFVGVGDPVGDGFVASIARPGGSITGFAGSDGPMGSKWLEVLKEAAPQVTTVMAVIHPETPIQQAMWRSIFAMKGNGGLVILPHAITWANEDLIIALALRHRLPAVFATEGSVTAGGLVSYGQDFEHNFRQTAEYVDRILRGEKPSDLPVQYPTKFGLTINLKTAKAIGIEIPPIFLARADKVIE